MKINKVKKMLALGLSLTMLAGMAVTVSAEGYTGWKTEDGIEYWYENDIKQGLEGRGKEIYDGSAWYWLDAPNGLKAVSKDVYQESLAGEWGDNLNDAGEKIGKWVRYDENGHMIKGWNVREDGTWYFDVTFGTMAKGDATIDGVNYTFNNENGKMESASVGMDNKWVNIDGVDYWYEGGVRQGYDPANPNYRGKEIFDPASNAWYWLDNVDKGKRATSKDVYQESKADDAGNIGKWVRYDENGHMIKGWNEKDGNTYYFDPVYGTMAKGVKTIDNKTYKFDEQTGVLLGEVNVRTYYRWRAEKNETLDAEGKQISSQEYKYENDQTQDYNAIVYYEEGEVDRTVEYERNADGDIQKQIYKNAAGVVTRVVENKYNEDGLHTYNKSTYYKENGEVKSGSIYEYAYDAEGKETGYKYYYYVDGEFKLNSRCEYTYENNLKKESYEYSYDYSGNDVVEKLYDKEVYTYENGIMILRMSYRAVYEDDGFTVKEWKEGNKSTFAYDADGNTTEQINYYKNYKGEWVANNRYVYEYDKHGNEIKDASYSWNSETESWDESYIYYYVYSDYERNGYTYTKYDGYYYTNKGKYQYGYEYVNDENGNTVKCIYYTTDKELDYYELYPTTSYPASKPENVGTVYEAVYEKYDKDDKFIGKRVYTSKLISYQVER